MKCTGARMLNYEILRAIYTRWMEKESERWSENFISLQEEWNKGTFNPSIKKKGKLLFIYDGYERTNIYVRKKRFPAIFARRTESDIYLCHVN